MAQPSPLRVLLYAVVDLVVALLAAIIPAIPIAIPVGYWWLRA